MPGEMAGSTNSFMERALAEAEAAGARGEAPIGAAIVRGGEIVAACGNRTRELDDVTAHAEILAIRAAAARFRSERLVDCDLYVTLEPCTLCAAAISFARIRRLYYGAGDPKGGGVEHGIRFFYAPPVTMRQRFMPVSARPRPPRFSAASLPPAGSGAGNSKGVLMACSRRRFKSSLKAMLESRII